MASSFGYPPHYLMQKQNEAERDELNRLVEEGANTARVVEVGRILIS